MRGLRRALHRDGFDAEVWTGAVVFGDSGLSVERLRARLADELPGLGVVTHSFGDWLLRQAIATDPVTVTSLVSLVPVMASSRAAKLAMPVGRRIPGIGVIASDRQAAGNLDVPPQLDRLVVWARFDPWVRQVPVTARNTRTVVVNATHNSLLWQPRVHRLVSDYFVPNL